MDEVLFAPGTKVSVVIESDEAAEYLIIGRRAYNPNSGKSWDYIGVPLPGGFMMQNRKESPFDWTNLCFFNHVDICNVVSS